MQASGCIEPSYYSAFTWASCCVAEAGQLTKLLCASLAVKIMFSSEINLQNLTKHYMDQHKLLFPIYFKPHLIKSEHTQFCTCSVYKGFAVKVNI